jgi:hypothetical protein
MKDKILVYTKDIGKGVIQGLIVTGLIALFVLPTTKDYMFKLFSWFYGQKLPILILIIILIVIFLFKKIIKTNKKIDLLSEELVLLKKTQTPSVTQLQKFETLNTEIQKVKHLHVADIQNLKSDLYEIKRDYQLRKAKRHQKLNQRGALLCRLNVVSLDINEDDSFNLNESLEELFDYVKSETSFSTQDLSEAKDTLNKVISEGQKEIANQILEKIKSKLI